MQHIRDEINDTDPAFVNEIQRFGTLGYTLCGLIEGAMTIRRSEPDSTLERLYP